MDLPVIDLTAIKDFDGWLQLYRPHSVLWFRQLRLEDQARLASSHMEARELNADQANYLVEMGERAL